MAEKKIMEAGTSDGGGTLDSRYDTMDSRGGTLKAQNYTHDDTDAKERGNWGGKLDFLLSAIGYAVGLGNVWRFPYLCYRNGGGAFLIPYAIFLATAGLPLFFMELALGQFGSQGPITIWKAVPMFKGIGWAMVVMSGLVSVYYNVIIAWTIFYFFASFTSELPWQKCGHWWNTNLCRERIPCNVTDVALNCTPQAALPAGVMGKTPSEEYWEHYVLGISDGIDNIGGIKWQLCLCLLLAWIVIFLCLIKGVKSSGKVVYVTATFPYIVLVILLIRGVTLPGAGKGIKYYITPEWERLGDSRVWADAAIQIFYSLGVAFGGLEVMASYNPFRNNCYRDALIVAILNCCTSVFAGFVIFSVIGFMSESSGVPIAEVTASGPGLAFVAYPEGIAMMPVAPLWSILFFLMLFTLGLDSQFAMMETVISAISDEFLKLRKRKILLTFSICTMMFLLGLPMCCNGGIYIFTLFDWYSASFSLMIVSLSEILVLMWIYGRHRFSEDIELMIGFKPNIYWRACWMFITPFMIVFIMIFSFVQYVPVFYGIYKYPVWAQVMGWMMTFASVIMIPIFALVVFCRKAGARKIMRRSLRPTYDWGPALTENRTGRYKHHKHYHRHRHIHFYSDDTELRIRNGVDKEKKDIAIGGDSSMYSNVDVHGGQSNLGYEADLGDYTNFGDLTTSTRLDADNSPPGGASVQFGAPSFNVNANSDDHHAGIEANAPRGSIDINSGVDVNAGSSSVLEDMEDPPDYAALDLALDMSTDLDAGASGGVEVKVGDETSSSSSSDSESDHEQGDGTPNVDTHF